MAKHRKKVHAGKASHLKKASHKGERKGRGKKAAIKA
jgi:hypothetical protein